MDLLKTASLIMLQNMYRELCNMRTNRENYNKNSLNYQYQNMHNFNVTG